MIQVTQDKHRTETLLREREQLFAATLRSIGGGVITTDVNESVTFLNSLAESLTGWCSNEAAGLPLDEVFRLRRENNGQAVSTPVRNALLTGGSTCLSEGAVLVPRSGSPVPIDVSAAPITDEKGQALGAVMVFRDVTDRRKTEAERQRLLYREQQARAEAEAANRAKDEFLATVSHELRTPLSAIMGWSTMLAAGNLDAATSFRALKSVERCARQQAQLVDDLLDVARIMTGSLRLDVQPVEWGSVVELAIDAVRPLAQAKAIQLREALDANAGPVAGDPVRLQQIVWNLLSNAVKFTPNEGWVQIKLERVGSRAQLVVTDSGPGIAPAFLPFVFDRFRQADGLSTQNTGGLGLGLAIVRHLVDLHRGSVSAQSEGTGRGATFTVSLPLMAAQAARPQLRLVPIGRPVSRDVDPAQLRGVAVLIVDDDSETRELLKSIFLLAGAETSTAACSAEALETLARDRPNIIVCDIRMPNEDGYSLIRKIRARSEADGGRTPAIALTALARLEDRRRALLAGFQSHLAKPVEPTELLALVATLVGRFCERGSLKRVNATSDTAVRTRSDLLSSRGHRCAMPRT